MPQSSLAASLKPLKPFAHAAGAVKIACQGFERKLFDDIVHGKSGIVRLECKRANRTGITDRDAAAVLADDVREPVAVEVEMEHAAIRVDVCRKSGHVVVLVAQFAACRIDDAPRKRDADRGRDDMRLAFAGKAALQERIVVEESGDWDTSDFTVLFSILNQMQEDPNYDVLNALVQRP